MKRSSFVLAAIIGITAISSTPALAQNRRGNRESARAQQSERAAERPRADAAAPAPAQARQYAVPRAQAAAPPVVVHPNVAPRYNARPYVAHPYAGPVYVRPSYRAYPYARPYYYRPYAVAPYYSAIYPFRPNSHLSFGITLGYGVPYYAYPYPVSVYGYAAPPAPIVVGPNSTQYGGVSLELSPPDAQVFVDGNYAGVVADFDGTRQPLTLTAGRHHIDIDANGYRPFSFDVNVLPGQVLPYRGDLAR